MVRSSDLLDIESLDQAADLILDYYNEEREVLGEIAEKRAKRVMIRFKVGRVVHHVSESAGYGDGAVQKLADKMIKSESYLYQSRRFYEAHEGSEQACRRWIEETQSDSEKRLTWGYCREWSKNEVTEKDDYSEVQEKVDRKTKSLDRRSRTLDEDAQDLQEIARTADGLTEKERQEAISVAQHAQMVADDARRTAERVEIPEEERVESDRWREMVTTVDCFACGRAGSREDMNPHHLERSGHATKGPDTETIALCTDCHRKLHDMPEEKFWESVGVNPWKKLCQRILSPVLSALDLDALAEELEPYFRT
jgi:hypothetical protein